GGPIRRDVAEAVVAGALRLGSARLPSNEPPAAPARVVRHGQRIWVGATVRSISALLAAIEDPHRETRERLAAVCGYEPRVLHVEAVAAVLRNRVRMHREDHVLAQLGLDPFADLRMLDHRHPDRVARDVPEVVAALAEAFRHRAVDVVRSRAGLERGLRGFEVLDVRVEHRLDLAVRTADRSRHL